RIGKFAIDDDVVWILLEEKRRGLGVAAPFLWVFGVVAAHAINAVDREKLVRAPDRGRPLRGRSENVCNSLAFADWVSSSYQVRCKAVSDVVELAPWSQRHIGRALG